MKGSVADEFDEMARRGLSYEAAINRFYPSVYETYESVLTRIFRRSGPVRALDIGCGDGWTASVVRELCPELRYLGLDPAVSAVAHLNKETADSERIKAIVGDSRSLRTKAGWDRVVDFLGSAPDLWLCNGTLHEISKADDPHVFVNWLGSSATASSRVLLGDYYYPTLLGEEEIRGSLEWIERTTGHRASPPDDFLAREEVERILTDTGLRLEEVHEHPANSAVALRYYLTVWSVIGRD